MQPWRGEGRRKGGKEGGGREGKCKEWKEAMEKYYEVVEDRGGSKVK